MSFHSGGLRRQVVVDLVIGQPPEREPQEDGTGFESTSNFIDPDVVEDHPLGQLALLFARLGGIPEVGNVEVAPHFNWVPAPATTSSITEDAESARKNGSSRWSTSIDVTTRIENEWSK
jgi:hypothetical protein